MNTTPRLNLYNMLLGFWFENGGHTHFPGLFQPSGDMRMFDHRRQRVTKDDARELAVMIQNMLAWEQQALARTEPNPKAPALPAQLDALGLAQVQARLNRMRDNGRTEKLGRARRDRRFRKFLKGIAPPAGSGSERR